jgi:hypothetical protein
MHHTIRSLQLKPANRSGQRTLETLTNNALCGAVGMLRTLAHKHHASTTET